MVISASVVSGPGPDLLMCFFLSAGILEESEDWVAPLLANKKLQDALLTYTKPPRTYERLNDLTEYVSEGEGKL